MSTLLDELRRVSQVDCDTLDCDIAKSLGPFVDCTSNQAIAFLELQRPVVGQAALHHDALIKESVQAARGELKDLLGEASFEEFVVEILMVKLQLLILPHITGMVHVQANPKYSYSAHKIIHNAKRIIAIFLRLAPGRGHHDICIKIPGTWEGLEASRALREEHYRVLVTTVFGIEQASLAAAVGSTYIAPYVNELKVHFQQGHVDENKGFELCREAQAFYKHRSSKTEVLAASLTSVDEVMKLAGVRHITVSAALLKQLAERDAGTWNGKIGEFMAQEPLERSWERPELYGPRDESIWKDEFAKERNGVSKAKTEQAVEIFVDFQDKLEDLVRQYAAHD